MEIPDYPPNKPKEEQKDIKRITSEEPIRRKKGLGRQFKETFVGGSAKNAVDHVVFDVLLPAAREMVFETGSEFLNRLIFGDTRRRRGSVPPQTGPYGNVQYHQMSRTVSPTYAQRVMSQRARASHDFDEIVLQSRQEAENVIDELFEIVSRYGSVNVADLYELVGIKPTHTDNKWGWTDLRGSGVSRVRGGYLLGLPEPAPLDAR